MKYTKYLAIVLASALSAAGCTGDFEDINSDPNNIIVGDIEPANMLEPLLMNGANALIYNTYYYCNEISQVTVASASNVRDEHRYNITNSNYSTIWNLGFNWAKNAKHMHDLAVNNGDVNYQAIGLTLKVYYLQLVTDVFGGIPYQEALQGDSGLLKPRVETQKEVYEGMIADLERANSLYNTSVVLPKKEKDAMFQGDILKWKKFTNSLRLRALLRVIDSKELGDLAKAELKKMLADPTTYPVFESNDDNAKVHISGIAPDEAPMTRPSDLSAYKSLSAFFIDRLQDWKDPRLEVFATQATNKDPQTGQEVTSFIGLPSGYDVEPTFTASSPNAANLATAPQDIQCLTYAEVLFIKAELAQRGLISDDARLLYEKAVAAAITQWGVEVPDGYFDNGKAAYDGTLRRIMEQKFYALFFIDFQQWFEYNRTGYPDVPKGPGVDASLHMPYRFKYPAILQRMNREHYLEAVKSMGGDDFNTRLIWQKRPEL